MTKPRATLRRAAKRAAIACAVVLVLAYVGASLDQLGVMAARAPHPDTATAIEITWLAVVGVLAFYAGRGARLW